MIYDCFTFFDGLDLLEIRLNILNEVVDKFVIVEATKTHAGQDKPLYFQDNKERFAKFADKIIHVVVDDTPPVGDDCEIGWVNENHQRNCIVRGLEDIRPEDDILVSDFDEIPDPVAILKWRGTKGIKRFKTRMFYYFLNYRDVASPDWYGTRMLSYETFLNSDSAEYKYSRFLLKSVNKGPTFTKIRRSNSVKNVLNAGWHFSYLGGIEAIQLKIKSFSHQEFNRPEFTSREHIEKCLASGRDVFDRKDHRYLPVPIDKTFPAYIREHAEELKDLIYPVNTRFFSRENLLRLLYAFKIRG